MGPVTFETVPSTVDGLAGDATGAPSAAAAKGARPKRRRATTRAEEVLSRGSRREVRARRERVVIVALLPVGRECPGRNPSHASCGRPNGDVDRSFSLRASCAGFLFAAGLFAGRRAAFFAGFLFAGRVFFAAFFGAGRRAFFFAPPERAGLLAPLAGMELLLDELVDLRRRHPVLVGMQIRGLEDDDPVAVRVQDLRRAAREFIGRRARHRDTAFLELRDGLVERPGGKNRGDLVARRHFAGAQGRELEKQRAQRELDPVVLEAASFGQSEGLAVEPA